MVVRLADMQDGETFLVVPKPHVVLGRRAIPGETVGSVQITADGPEAVVIYDPESQEMSVWLAEELEAVFDILPKGSEGTQVPIEGDPGGFDS